MSFQIREKYFSLGISAFLEIFQEGYILSRMQRRELAS